MTVAEFMRSLRDNCPAPELSASLAALWWDAKGDWARAHDLVNELDTRDGMAVHAYLHRKEGADGNANYWYRRCGSEFCHSTFEEEWKALVAGLLG